MDGTNHCPLNSVGTTRTEREGTPDALPLGDTGNQYHDLIDGGVSRRI